MIIQLQLIIFTLTCDLRCAPRQEKQEKSEGKNYSSSFMAYRASVRMGWDGCLSTPRLDVHVSGPGHHDWAIGCGALWCGVVWCRQMSNHLIYHLHREQRMLPNFIGKHKLTVSQLRWRSVRRRETGEIKSQSKLTANSDILYHHFHVWKPVILSTINFSLLPVGPWSSGCIVLTHWLIWKI